MTLLDSGRKPGLAAGATCAFWFLYFVVATTSGFGWQTTWHNEQRAAQIVLLSATALVAAWSLRHISAVNFFLGIPRSLWWFLALGLIAAGAARFPGHSLAEISLFVALLGLVLVVWLTASRFSPRMFAWAAIAIGAAHVTGVLTRYATAISISRPLDLDVILLGYANPRFPSALYALLIPFLASAAVAVHERKSIRVVAFVVLIALWSVNLALTSRAIFFSYVVAAPILLFLVGSARVRSMLLALVASFVLGAVLYWLMFFLVPAWAGLSTGEMLRSREALSGTSGRLDLWAAATELIASAPVLGVGPMHFAAVSHPYGAHPHNSILQLASEYGVPATLLFGYVAWKLIQTSAGAIRQSAADKNSLGAPALLAVIVAATYSLVDGNYLMPVSQTAFAMCLGLLLAKTSPLGLGTTGSLIVSPWAPRLAGVILAASAIYLSVYAAATVRDGTPAPGGYSLPRFWEQGFIGKAGDERMR